MIYCTQERVVWLRNAAAAAVCGEHHVEQKRGEGRKRERSEQTEREENRKNAEWGNKEMNREVMKGEKGRKREKERKIEGRK